MPNTGGQLTRLNSFVPALVASTKKLLTRLFTKEGAPKTTNDLLKSLSKAHKAVGLWKGSAGRSGAARVLSLVKAHHPNIDLDKLLAGRPASKMDGSPLTDKDFQAIVVSMRGYATKIAEACEEELSYPPFDMEGKMMSTSSKKPRSSTPQVPEDRDAGEVPAKE